MRSRREPRPAQTLKKWEHRERARQVLAQETGYVLKPHGGRLRVALAFPNTYWVGMSSLGFQTVYGLFNKLDDVACERVFLPPKQELQWWYQFYFATERGKAGYAANTNAFNRQIWELASPQWAFDDATYARSAASFANPDHVAIVIHNYRWRLGLAQGERQYDAVEAKLAAAPPVTIPAITMEGDANGAPHPDPSRYRAKFTGPYEHRTIAGGIGHNLPQEAPSAFAKAIIDVGRGAG